MYNTSFVAVIKSNGKILREDTNGIIRIPFGSEYSILLKNLNTVDAVVDVEIDGENVLNGNNLVISPNNDFELFGKLKNLKQSNKFKFIHKTKQISNYRGDRIDDGIVRITYSFVKPHKKNEGFTPFLYPYNPKSTYRTYKTYRDVYKPFYGDNIVYSSCAQEGITVNGEEFNCDYTMTCVDDLESAIHVLIFKLVGKTKNKKKIRKHLYVKTPLVCKTCGKKSKSSNKYCGNCGTYLR